MATITRDINLAAEYLNKNEVVAIPTETVYGLAGNAFNVIAIEKIFNAKQRPSYDPLIVHTDHIDKIESFVQSIPEEAKILAKHFWPGPLTLIFTKKSLIPDLVTSGLSTVGVRIPDHPVTRELLSKLTFPLAAPSANPFGYISPTSAKHVDDQLGNVIPLILDGGICKVGLESTIIGFEGKSVIIYRPGIITLNKIKAVLPEVEIIIKQTAESIAPGMLENHYAPLKPLYLGDISYLAENHKGKKIAILNFKEYKSFADKENQIVLSPSGDLNEAAFNLYSSLRILDKMRVDLILAETVPEEELGKVINERLYKASFKS